MNTSPLLEACISLDVDWAPDEVIEAVLAKFLDAKVKSTWLITHDFRAISTLRKHPELFEVGIHPNFLPDSSHGVTAEQVMETVLRFAPDAEIMRTHSLYQSTSLFRLITEKYPQIKTDLSLFLPNLKDVAPHRLYINPDQPDRFITRIPFIWEDDIEMSSPDRTFVFEPERFSGTGLKIFNFHPIHVALNSREFTTYDQLKRRTNLRQITLKDCLACKNSSAAGTEDFFNQLLLAQDSVKFRHIREIADASKK